MKTLAGDLVPVEEARAFLLKRIRALPPRPVPLEEAAGLVLAEAVEARLHLPRFPNAAMDGYAVRSGDVRGVPATLRVVGRALPGPPPGLRVGPGEAVAVATGAQIPEGSDAVVPLESARRRGDSLAVIAPVEPGQHVRAAGEDVRAGEVLVEAGTVLGPGQLAAAAALGLARVRVHPRPRVAVVPTGDEIRPPGEPLGPGEVHDAVSAPLAALLREVGAVPDLHPVVPDDPAALASVVREAAARTDAVLTVGGVSVGARDLVGLGGLGDVRPLRLALRPAKPFAFGEAFGVPLFGLPGNPASALAAFEELVRPALLAMMGREPALRPALRAVLAEPFVQRPGRLHLVRARVWREGSRLLALPAGRQGAGMVHSLARANAWAVIPAEATELPAGAEVEVRLLTEPQ